MNRDRLRASIAGHEALRLKPYFCTEGKLTIGYGRNLEDVGISPMEAELMLTHDINKAEADCRQSIPTFKDLSPVRQEVLVEMVFQMGLTRVLKFKKFLAALRLNDYTMAHREMLDSLWARQTTSRAMELAKRMKDNE